jgi:hypothetical protein
MSFIYIVIENGETYPNAYQTYILAQAAIKAKWDEEVQCQYTECGEGCCSNIDLPENPSGTTHLYVEKEINIVVHRLPILQ